MSDLFRFHRVDQEPPPCKWPSTLSFRLSAALDFLVGAKLSPGRARLASLNLDRAGQSAGRKEKLPPLA